MTIPTRRWSRRHGNRAVHEHFADDRTALTMLRHCFGLGVWLHRSVTGDRSPFAFVAPEPGSARSAGVQEDLVRYRDELITIRESLQGEIDRLRAAAEARREAEAQLAASAAAREELSALVGQLAGDVGRLRAELDARVASPAKLTARERDAFVDRARRASRTPLTEAETRQTLDEMLADAGWVVQDLAALDLTTHPGVAVRSAPAVSARDSAVQAHTQAERRDRACRRERDTRRHRADVLRPFGQGGRCVHAMDRRGSPSGPGDMGQQPRKAAAVGGRRRAVLAHGSRDGHGEERWPVVQGREGPRYWRLPDGASLVARAYELREGDAG